MQPFMVSAAANSLLQLLEAPPPENVEADGTTFQNLLGQAVAGANQQGNENSAGESEAIAKGDEVAEGEANNTAMAEAVTTTTGEVTSVDKSLSESDAGEGEGEMNAAEFLAFLGFTPQEIHTLLNAAGVDREASAGELADKIVSGSPETAELPEKSETLSGDLDTHSLKEEIIAALRNREQPSTQKKVTEEPVQGQKVTEETVPGQVDEREEQTPPPVTIKDTSTESPEGSSDRLSFETGAHNNYVSEKREAGPTGEKSVEAALVRENSSTDAVTGETGEPAIVQAVSESEAPGYAEPGTDTQEEENNSPAVHRAEILNHNKHEAVDKTISEGVSAAPVTGEERGRRPDEVNVTEVIKDINHNKHEAVDKAISEGVSATPVTGEERGRRPDEVNVTEVIKDVEIKTLPEEAARFAETGSAEGAETNSEWGRISGLRREKIPSPVGKGDTGITTGGIGIVETATSATETTATGNTPEPPRPVETEVINQVKGRIRSVIRNGTRELTIKLDPPSLGSLVVKVQKESKITKITMVAENRMVKSIIESNLPELRQALAEQGIQAEQFTVTVGGGNHFEGRDPGAGEGSWSQREWRDDTPGVESVEVAAKKIGAVLHEGTINIIV